MGIASRKLTPMLVVLAALAAPTLAGCQKRHQPKTPVLILRSGAAAFHAPRPQVFAAALIVLKAQNYEVVLASEDMSRIRTARRLLRTTAQVESKSSSASVTGISQFRQLALEFTTSGEMTNVTIEPRYFLDDRDATDEVLRTMPAERDAWIPIFDEMNVVLRSAPSTPPSAMPSASATTM